MNNTTAIRQPVQDASVELLDDGGVLRLSDGHGRLSRFHAVWLRDNGQDPQSRNVDNHQKLIAVNHFPADTHIESACVEDNGALTLTFGPDKWQTCIDIDWLWAHQYDRQPASSEPLFAPHVATWGNGLDGKLPRTSYADAKNDEAVLLKWLQDIDRFGVAIMRDLPIQSEAVLDVIGLFGCVRETNYGRFFEIKAVENPTNLAASALGLQAHTDNPYRDPVPTLQFFACLQNDAEGGESIVVDGFRAAELLHTQSPASFELLSHHSAEFDFHGSDDVHLRSVRPMIECSPEGQVICVRFNNRSAHAFTHIPFEKMQAYYDAYRRFAELICDTRQEVTFKLAPGELFVTDNTRVLHSRKAFSGGVRWMQGAYSDKDSLQSKIAVLSKTTLRQGSATQKVN